MYRILTVGPSFQVYVQGKATLDTVLNLNVDLAYNVSNANLVYPPRNDTNQTMFDDSFNPSDTSASSHIIHGVFTLKVDVDTSIDLDLSVAPGLPSHGSLEAHIIPAVSIFSSYQTLWSHAPHTMKIVFGIEAFNGIARANVFLDLYTAAILNLSLNQTTAPTTTNSSDAQFAGCVGVQTALSVNVGTDASFFDVFENTTSIPLFESEWDLFEVSILL